MSEIERLAALLKAEGWLNQYRTAETAVARLTERGVRVVEQDGEEARLERCEKSPIGRHDFTPPTSEGTGTLRVSTLDGACRFCGRSMRDVMLYSPAAPAVDPDPNPDAVRGA